MNINNVTLIILLSVLSFEITLHFLPEIYCKNIWSYLNSRMTICVHCLANIEYSRYYPRVTNKYMLVKVATHSRIILNWICQLDVALLVIFFFDFMWKIIYYKINLKFNSSMLSYKNYYFFVLTIYIYVCNTFALTFVLYTSFI